MSTVQDNSNGTRKLARFAAAILFVLLVTTGYAISPRVEGAVNSPVAAEDQDIAEPEYLPSDCAVDGLVFADCDFDF